ncbi:uncharacterized protein [Magallana gigas]|uniref:uncharacterized protein isoform X2 n=1 Tax=Magallana gigas TaxID=29159 RepID=UPI00333FC33B
MCVEWSNLNEDKPFIVRSKMFFSQTANLWSLYCLLVMFLYKPENTYAVKTLSFISFIYTDPKSPDDLEDTCFDIDNTSVSRMHFAISRVIDNTSSSCNSENTTLTEIRKYIIHNDHRRPLCRTKLTVSMSREQCEKTIVHLEYYCQHLDEYKANIFFQECMVTNTSGDEEPKATELGAITMSRFPKQMRGKQGREYEFPRAHCSMKECTPEVCSTNGYGQTTIPFHKDSTRKPEEETPMKKYLILGVGFGGLIVGILSTAIVFICINRHRKRRIMNDDLISDSNIHRMTQTNRKFSIHSKGGETVYHDIADIPGPSKNDQIKGVSNVFLHDDSPEQRYSPSPKSSTSTYENESISSKLSSKKVVDSSRGSKSCEERPQVYHTLSKDYNTASTNTENENILTKETLKSDYDVANYSPSETNPVKHGGQCVLYEQPISLSSSKKSKESQSIKSDNNPALSRETLTGEEATTSNVYHVLQGSEGISPVALLEESTM